MLLCSCSVPLFCLLLLPLLFLFFFFFNDTAPTEIYTLSLHDALPIFLDPAHVCDCASERVRVVFQPRALEADRKSTRLNSSHVSISCAVFCLKKKKKKLHRKIGCQYNITLVNILCLETHYTHTLFK